MHLVRAIVDAGEAGMAVHPLQRRVLGDALRPMHLNGAVDDVVQHLGAIHLDEADLHPCFVALIDLLRGMERQHPARLDFAGAVEDELLNLLMLAQRLAKRHAGVGAFAQQVEGALGLAEPAHAVEDAAGAQTVLRDLEALAARPEQVLLRHPHIVVNHFVVAIVVAHHAHVADDVIAGRLGRHHDHRERRVRRGVVRLRAHHRGGVSRGRSTRGEPLAAVDDPVVAIEFGAGLQLRGVGARDIRLRHAEARIHLARHQRRQVFLPPLVVRVAMQHDGILQRVRAEGGGGDGRAPDDLVDEHIVHEWQAAAADLFRMAQRP